MIFTFDPPETGWTLNSQCLIVANPTAPSQPNSLHVMFGSGTAACYRTLSGLVVGQSYDVYVRVNFDGDANGGAQLRIEYNDNPAQFSATLVKASDPDTGEPLHLGWELRYLGQLHYTFADRVLRINGLPLPFELSTVELDAIYIGEAPPTSPTEEQVAAMARKWSAIDAANGVIRGINGATDGYNVAMTGVYSRLFTPAEQPDVALPYACIPLDQEGESLEYEGMMFISSWKLVGHAFFADNPESDPLNSEGSIQAAKFRDDLVRAFMADQSLGGETQNCVVTSIDTASGVIDDGIAEVIFTIEFTQMAGASDLEAA